MKIDRAAEEIRSILKPLREPISTADLARQLNKPQSTVVMILRRMPDAWIEAWKPQVGKGRPGALWRVKPDNCPPPPKKHRA